jgi:hypothetical protein
VSADTRGKRPRGIKLLVLFLAVAAVLPTLRAVAVAARRPAELLDLRIWPVLLLNLVLPVIWVGATAVGIYCGRSWARWSYFALAVLVLVLSVGAVGRPLDSDGARTVAACLVLLAVAMGWGVWYLLGGRVSAWFR